MHGQTRTYDITLGTQSCFAKDRSWCGAHPPDSLLRAYLVAGLEVVEQGNKESHQRKPPSLGCGTKKEKNRLGTHQMSIAEGVDQFRRVRSHRARRWYILSSSLEELLARFQKSQLARPQVLDDRRIGHSRGHGRQ